MTDKVIFRKWKDAKREGDIIALFPEIPFTYGGDITSYEHIGQHGGADYNAVLSMTSPASPAEYAHLLEELQSIGYELQVVTRRTSQMYDNYIANLYDMWRPQ